MTCDLHVRLTLNLHTLVFILPFARTLSQRSFIGTCAQVPCHSSFALSITPPRSLLPPRSPRCETRSRRGHPEPPLPWRRGCTAVASWADRWPSLRWAMVTTRTTCRPCSLASMSASLGLRSSRPFSWRILARVSLCAVALRGTSAVGRYWFASA